MFGFGKKRFDALREALHDTRAIVAESTTPGRALYHELATTLREALHAVVEHDLEAVYADPAQEAVLEEARTLLAWLEEQEKGAARRERRVEDAGQSRAVVARLHLQRCRACDSRAFYVRENVRFETQGAGVEAAVVVCASCGELRLRMKSPEALAALADDRDFRYVELPDAGPFRG